MSKKKATGNTMTLKDFHGGSIPTDLPLPSAPGVVPRSTTDRPGYDRASWGNPIGRSDQRTRPSSSPSIRNFDDKTPFLAHTSNIGRNFDEDERKPLDGASAPRRMVSDDSFRVPSSRVEVKPESVSIGRLTGWQGSGSPYSGKAIDAVPSGIGDQILGSNSENSVSGTYPNAWAARKEATMSGNEPGQSAWAAQTAVSKLVNASAVEKVSSGRWQSKLLVPGQVAVEVLKHSELESGLSKNNHDTVNRGDVLQGRESSDVMLARHLERGLGIEEGIQGGRKVSPDYGKSCALPYSEVKEVKHAMHKNGLHSNRSDARYAGPEAQPTVPSEVTERPKLKLLPRTKPLDNVEKPVNDAKQESGTSIIDDPETGSLTHKSTNSLNPGSSANESGNQAAERPKLNLKPRSQLLEHSEANTERERNDVFGGARPRELVLKERGIDETEQHELVQQPDRVKPNDPKTERAPEQVVPSRHGERPANVPHEMRTRKFDKKDNRSGADTDRSETQRRNWRSNDNKRNNISRETEGQQQPPIQEKRQPSPETWRKPAEPQKSDSPDGSGLRRGKAASALELAQAFSKPFSDPKAGNGFNVQRGVSDRNQVPFSRLMGPNPTPSPSPTPTPRQINGY